MKISIKQDDNRYLLVPQSDGDIAIEIFDPQWLRKEGLLLKSEIAGRASVHFFAQCQYDMVLREYRRGGAASKISQTKYLWRGLRRSRPWRELDLLLKLKQRHLPVPTPYAAMLIKEGLFYRASLITYRLADTTTFAERLMKGPIPEWLWRRVGGVIRQLHDQNVYHSDLNANNVLINSNNVVFLIDFDKGEFRENDNTRWKFDNLARLQRSLNKIHGSSDVFHYSLKSWGLLTQGYASKSE